MSLIFADRVKETSTTTGTGTYTLAGAAAGYQSFGAVGNTNTCYYCAENGTDWEVGIGTYTVSGTTLARTTILASSNAGAAVNWSAGTRNIFLVIPAARAGGDMALLGSQTASGNPSELSVSGIAGLHTHLRVVIFGRGTGNVSVDDMRVIINGDTTAGNYSNTIFVEVTGGSPGGGSNTATSGGAAIGVSSGVSGNANAIASTDFMIYGYSQTTFHKTVQGRSFNIYSAQLAKFDHFTWKSSAAVTSVSVAAIGSTWENGSKISVYGLV